MDLSALMANLRPAAAKAGAVELPAFPGVLPAAWLHPDVLVRLFTGGDGNWFGFPLTLDDSGCAPPGESCTVAFCWVRKPFQAGWMTRVQEVLAAAVDGEGRPLVEPPQLVGQPTAPTLFDEVGCAWKVLWRGSQAGEIRVLSAVGGERLPHPVGILRLDLSLLSGIIRGDVAAPAGGWSRDFPADDLYAWKWPLRPRELEELGRADGLPARLERLLGGFDQALGRKAIPEMALSLVEGGVLWRLLEAKGLSGQPVCAQVLATCRARFRKGFPVLAKAGLSAAGSPRGAKEGVLR
ncbi:MAG: hypothetical protein GX442_17205 [Candidatus Riflebacteria bacterium]|nr:hypothetical protein [Candidatus Riflebacteria bacterium]